MRVCVFPISSEVLWPIFAKLGGCILYVSGPPICPWGVLFRKGQRVDRSTGHFHFPLYYICASLTPHAAKGSFCFAGSAAESNRRLLLHCISTAYVGGPRNCYWGVLFLKGQRVDGSTGHFHFHYIIYDSRRHQAHATPLQKAHGVNGSTAQWVHGSTGQTGRRVNGSLSLYYIS